MLAPTPGPVNRASLSRPVELGGNSNSTGASKGNEAIAAKARDSAAPVTTTFARTSSAPLADERAPVLGQPLQQGMELRSEEHTSELQSLMRISHAVFCW